MNSPDALVALTNPFNQISSATISLVILSLAYFTLHFTELETAQKLCNSAWTSVRFVWNCFSKPHTGDGTGSQQDALESFYKSQAGIYDATRSKLLHGREDMLGLVAAQLKCQAKAGQLAGKPVWVDVGGGTGWNIEHMGSYLSVPHFFHKVYSVDSSPSSCAVARARFERLGWKNVVVVCQDARSFKSSEHESGVSDDKAIFSIGESAMVDGDAADTAGADSLTMSYSLSMIPEFHPVIDSSATSLAPNGIMGVVDFYVQSKVDFQSRNYTGGVIDRHCMWLSRVFWRTWFEADRVSLEAARRDYLEYKFGTVLSTNARNHFFGFRIPYYIWVGCAKQTKSSLQNLAALDAAVTESPFISALDLQRSQVAKPRRSDSAVGSRSKAYESAIVNLQASLPLPAAWYQQHHWRIYYDNESQKHTQFGDEYIYAFTWEDAAVDLRSLKINSEDVILAITSAGDNISSYALERPKRIHAVDLNPNQNHLLELKVAAYTASPYQDFWRLFGEGRHPDFRSSLIEKLSPHLSSQAFDYWLHKGPSTFSPTSRGLYASGGSRHASNLVHWMGRLLGVSEDIKRLCNAETLNEQREIWAKRVRRVISSQSLSYAVIGTERFSWKASGVPPAQRAMIEHDYVRSLDRTEQPSPPSSPSKSSSSRSEQKNDSVHKPEEAVASGLKSGHAIWSYGVNTLDPVVHNTLVSASNPYYLLCSQGHYTQRCHPLYLSPRAHLSLSSASAFDGSRIHTDESAEVFERMQRGTSTIAVSMDSMDWFDPRGGEAEGQVRMVNRALKMGGRVLLRSAGLRPWYVATFEGCGFAAKRVAARWPPGACVDRVNMYASTWISTKVAEVEDSE